MINKDTSPTIEQSLKMIEEKLKIQKIKIKVNKNIIKNSTAKFNDKLILTKPIGTGIITTAIKKELVDSQTANSAIEVMSTLNNFAAEQMKGITINACTDITGYGLLGHLNEICKSSNLTAKINI